MIFVATENFSMADTLGTADTHAALRTMAGQLNQVFFVDWERVELVLGIALTAILWFGIRGRLLASLSGAALILVVAQHFFVTPQMLALSAHLDSAATADQFAQLHAIYGIVEVVKLGFTIVLAVLLLPSWGRGRSPVEVQPVDYAHHGHIDR